jgi:hypothetical protein
MSGIDTAELTVAAADRHTAIGWVHGNRVGPTIDCGKGVGDFRFVRIHYADPAIDAASDDSRTVA